MNNDYNNITTSKDGEVTNTNFIPFATAGFDSIASATSLNLIFTSFSFSSNLLNENLGSPAIVFNISLRDDLAQSGANLLLMGCTRPSQNSTRAENYREDLSPPLLSPTPSPLSPLSPTPSPHPFTLEGRRFLQAVMKPQIVDLSGIEFVNICDYEHAVLLDIGGKENVETLERRRKEEERRK